jgi:hypothetical protein
VSLPSIVDTHIGFPWTDRSHLPMPERNPVWAYAEFDDKLPLEVITETRWDCALLFTDHNPSRTPVWQRLPVSQRAFLIIEWKGAVAYRVGRIDIRDDRWSKFDTVMKDVPQETRRITLG